MSVGVKIVRIEIQVFTIECKAFAVALTNTREMKSSSTKLVTVLTTKKTGAVLEAKADSLVNVDTWINGGGGGGGKEIKIRKFIRNPGGYSHVKAYGDVPPKWVTFSAKILRHGSHFAQENP